MSKSRVSGSRVVALGTGVLALALSACTSRMALKEGGSLPGLEGKALGVFTLRTANVYSPRFQPRVLSVEIDNRDRVRAFNVGRAFQKDEDGYEYLVSVLLEPGTHTLMDVSGESVQFPLFSAKFRFPVHGMFQLPAGKVTYVGRVEMVNRKRRADEPPSGPVTPPADQAAAGYLDGTFDITLSDRSEVDIPLFLQQYPYLNGIPIHTSVMRRYIDAGR